MTTLKDIYQNLDLYGAPVFIAALKRQFKSVCTRTATIPGPGSPASNTETMREDLKIKKAIFHRNNEVTVNFVCPQADGTAPECFARFF